jgi:hypothetical protein
MLASYGDETFVPGNEPPITYFLRHMEFEH